MRPLPLLLAVALFAVACSDSGVSPTSPDGLKIQASHDAPPGTDLGLGDDCDGESPCDAFFNGPAGYCFVPPLTDNHLSADDCSGTFVQRIPDGTFSVWACQVTYDDPDNPSGSPDMGNDCRGPFAATWDEGTEFYQTSVKFQGGKGPSSDLGKFFRLYFVIEGGDLASRSDDEHKAFRDVVVDPNLLAPADAIVLPVNSGNVPIKVRVTEDQECDDGGTGTLQNCLITSNQSFQLANNALVTFGAVTNPFFVNANLGQCPDVLEYPPGSGKRSHDLPRLGCTVEIDGEFALDEAAEIVICENDLGVDPAYLRVIHQQEDGGDPNKPHGLSVLPPVQANCGPLAPAPDPLGLNGFFGTGIEKLAGWLGVQDLIATTGMVQSFTGGGGAFYRNSTFELAVVTVERLLDMEASPPAAITDQAVLDLGSRPSNAAIPIGVQAVTSTGAAVAGQTVHWFLDGYGSVACPTGLVLPASCETSTSDWGEAASFTTGTDGQAWVWWTPGDGPTATREVYAVSCGSAIYADAGDANGDTPTAGVPTGEIAGVHEFCDRDPTTFNGYKNGPNPGADPFDAVDAAGDPLTIEIALNDPFLTWQAQSCPRIDINGLMTNSDGQQEWTEECVGPFTAFTAPLKGKETGENAWLYTHNANGFLYVGLKVLTTDLDDAYVSFVENGLDGGGAGYPVAGDDLLELRLKNITSPATGAFGDYHNTQSCIDSQGKTFCGDPDDEATYPTEGAGAAAVTGGEYVFYEFKQRLNGSDPNDLGNPTQLSAGDLVGYQLFVTGGRGGSKGGFSHPEEFRTYHTYTIK